MASNNPTDPDSVTSSPRSDEPHHQHTRVRFMCSFGGKILPRPHDNQLRYVGGDTRMVAVHRHTTFSSLLTKLSKLSVLTDFTVKYQLPNEDLDALITVTTDEDVENMMEEYERILQNNTRPGSVRLRVFLFSTEPDSRASSINSLLDGSTKRESWFLDALNGGNGSGLERGRSEASSIVSEVPDYLFGLDNSDEQPKPRNRHMLSDAVSNSDPGSPFGSTSSIPNLPPVKIKPDNPIPITGYAGTPTFQYHGPPVQHIPVYYVPGQVPVQPYVQQFQAPMPVGFGQPIQGMSQTYGPGPVPGPRQVDPYDVSPRVLTDTMNPPPAYYGVRNAGPVPTYPAMMLRVGEEFPGMDANPGRASQ